MEKYKIVHGNNTYQLAESVNKEIENGFLPLGRAFYEETRMNQTMIHKSALKGLEEYISKGIFEMRNK